MLKRILICCLVIVLLLPGCDTIQSWLPHGNSNPTPTTAPQTLPLPGSENSQQADSSLPGDHTLIPQSKELKSTATAIASNTVTQIGSLAQKTFTYTLQSGTPVAVANFTHPDKGCNWMGVGGQVFNPESEPVLYLVVEAGGSLNGATISALALTGSATGWGPGGFEIKLSDKPVESSGTVWVQFYDLGGTPLSDRVYFTTYSSCNQNAILVNMVQPKPPTIKFYLPMIDTTK